jgi:TonB family protein
MIGAYADGVVYAVYVFDNPEPRDSLEAFISDHTERDRLNISTARPVKLGTVTGKEYSSQDQDIPATARFFAVGDLLYKFTATGAPADDAGVNQFFSSITIGKTQGIEVSDGPGLPFDQPGGDFLTGKQVDRKVRVIMKPEPAYTVSARQAAVVGTVVLKVVFSRSGSVNNIRTVESLPHGLTEEAISAARKIKFIPAIKDGKYVSMWMQLEYNFSLY